MTPFTLMQLLKSLERNNDRAIRDYEIWLRLTPVRGTLPLESELYQEKVTSL